MNKRAALKACLDGKVVTRPYNERYEYRATDGSFVRTSYCGLQKRIDPYLMVDRDDYQVLGEDEGD